MKRRIRLLAVAAALAGCSSSTSPHDFAGTWMLTSTDLTGSGNTCTLNGTVQFTQNGSTLGGTLPDPGVVVSCTSASGPSTAQSIGPVLVTGFVNGTGVSFNLDTGSVIASGNYTGSGTMSGTSIVVWYPRSLISVTGTWTATLTQ